MSSTMHVIAGGSAEELLLRYCPRPNSGCTICRSHNSVPVSTPNPGAATGDRLTPSRPPWEGTARRSSQGDTDGDTLNHTCHIPCRWHLTTILPPAAPPPPPQAADPAAGRDVGRLCSVCAACNAGATALHGLKQHKLNVAGSDHPCAHHVRWVKILCPAG